MNTPQSLQNLLNGTASEEDVELLKRLLASGEISIGGNVNQSVIIIGNGNTVELPPAALDRLGARRMLGNLDRDLTGEEIASGLRRLDKLLPNRAPILIPHYKEQVGRLRPTLKTEIKSLSESARRERVEALAAINSICIEAVDVSFNGIALGEEAPRYDARSPFRGLESFRPADSEFFFGREALTQKLVGKINAHSFLAVLGASGSGKSSLVMAGMIPALDSDYAIFRPGTNPLDELESARGKSLIVVDQFEELFTLTRDESTRKDFIVRLLDESSRARIILTLRSDFLGEVGAYRTLSAEIQNHLEIVPPMELDELRRAMEGQAGVVGLRFEADLSQQILDDVEGEPGAMPLLQHALWELWNRRHGRWLRASEYRAFGGVKQAITRTAEKAYGECTKAEQEQMRDIFLRLTRLDENNEGHDTRRRIPLSDLIPSERDTTSITLLLDKLANARLIVKTVNEDKIEVEVAHEALIRHWERLRLWLNEDRDNVRLMEGISDATRQWISSGRDEILLIHRGSRLELAVGMSENENYKLNPTEQEYINACVLKELIDQQQKQSVLQKYQTKWAQIGELVSTLTHRIGNDVGLIQVCAYKLKEIPDLDNYAQKQVEIISTSANGLIGLTSQFFGEGLSRIFKEEQQTKRVEITKVILATIEQCQELKNFNLSVSLDIEPTYLLADYRLLETMFRELIDNAVLSTPENGNIDIRAKRMAKIVEIEVADTGKDITPEYADAIFKPFRKLGDKINSFGLWWVRGFIGELGGNITIQPNKDRGKGAIFTVTLPVE